MSAPPSLLATASIAKSYGPVVALRSVDFTVRPGEIHALLGANGAGKSTLVKILAGVQSADAGQMFVDGRPVTFPAPIDAMAAGIATVFQDPALIPHLTVEENLRLSAIATAKFVEWLAWFDLTDLDLSALVRELPLDALRMVDLARAVARDPQVLLLDEITAALTADQAERVFALLAHWKELGRSAVLITHRLAEVMRVCDRATILRDGRNVALLETASVNEHQLVEAMLGAPVKPVARDNRQNGRAGQSQAAFEARGLTSRHLVRDVSFTVRSGEILGVVALEGQGQDRLFELLSGDRRPTAGEILVGNKPRRFHSPYDAVRDGVVLVPGDRLLALLPSLSVRQNLAVPIFNRLRRWLGIPADEPQRVANAIDRLSIDTRAASQVRRLSGGNQQKVVIGRWLVAGFRTLLCFDPTRGIDIQTKREIYALLRELAANGAAILLYTSELAEIPLVCDRVIVIHAGRIVDEQPAATATESSLLTAAHGLEVAL
ncbi:MAG: sugar ABC transporter ATP-binding protein [Caldilineaceae bacterium]|nr:sugar ABC transporter ATP-binding protein [Caldilineaceae bacterium]HRJ42182.1 sugar ABC transporter ATP-binding protein [Caldilineaceae bacterium]